MRIVLAAVNAKYIHSNPAVYSLRAYAKEYASEITVAEYTINHRTEDILADLYRRKPDILAFSCYIWNIVCVRELAEEIHKLLPETELWFGGPEVSYDAGRVLEECPHVRGVMRGEGEQTFLELMDYYHGRTKRELSDILGLTVRIFEDGGEPGPEGNRGRIVRTADRPPLSMDELPFIYENWEDFEHRIVYYETSRGCPFSCSYCLSSIDRRVRFRSWKLVERELSAFLSRRVPQVKFVDRTFNCNRAHALAVWRYVAEHDNGVTNFHFEIAADLLGEEELKLFRTMRPGLIQLEIGVQSVNMDTIREVRRTMDLAKLRKQAAAVRECGNIHQHLDLIAGLPGEDFESFRRSYGEVYAMEPHQLQLGFLKVLKGSELEARAGEYGIVRRGQPPYEVLRTRWLSYEELLRLKRVEEMTEIYYNSGQFENTLRCLAQEYGNPFDLYEELGAYYEDGGLDSHAPARIRRYDILLDFLRERFSGDAKRLELYRELLTLDLYLRENVKSRPDWARDPAPYREAASRFYRAEEERRAYLKDYEGFRARQLAGMTHLEVFHFPAAVPGMSGREPEGVYPVLFDYRRRDALTRAAAVYRLTEADGWRL